MDSGTRVGKYAVGRKLGSGGFGVLYIARDTELDREVAIKFLRPEHAFKPHVVQRFLQEARAAARISHPGIVTVFECGEVAGTNTRADGTVYIAMELLAGETLAARIRREKLPLGIAIGMARQLAAALAAAHDAQIVHRDLKPSNVFLVPDGAIVGGERVKILDFGIAKLVDGWGATIQTHSMEMLGTPMYMSPEQCKSSARVDARSDIYTLGCMLFELVCGAPPFSGDAGELIAKHQLVAPPLASLIAPSIPPLLDALIARMLAKSPDDRPHTMIEVGDALDRAAAEPARHVGPLGTIDPQTRADELATTVASRQHRPRRALWLGSGLAAIAGIAIAIATPRCTSDVAAVAIAPRDAALAFVATARPDAAPDALLGVEIEVDAPAGPAKPVGTPCDADAQVAAGTAEEARGNHAQALARYDSALRCKFDTHSLQLAFMAACNGSKVDFARKYWRRMSPDIQSHMIQICTHNHITVDDLNGTCNADDLIAAGTASEAKHDHPAALASYDAALACQANSHALQLAFMSACNAANASAAKKYWKRMSPDQQSHFLQICLHNHVTADMLNH